MWSGPQSVGKQQQCSQDLQPAADRRATCGVLEAEFHKVIPYCVWLSSVQVLLFNLLPPPGSPPLQEDVPGEAWVPPPVAVEVQDAVVDAIDQVRMRAVSATASDQPSVVPLGVVRHHPSA